jgi:hypothetical protein
MTAFVLGNGVSRENIDIDHLMTLGRVYGCNALYRTHRVTALIATDHPIARVIQESGYSRENRFYTRRPLPDLGAEPVPKPYFGFSSGPIAVAIAAQDRHRRIYLLGFDLGPNQDGKFNNLYAGTDNYKPQGAAPTYTGNWIRQLVRVANDFPDREFVRVQGPTTARHLDLDRVSNISHLPIESFLERINTGKDL